jgi:hypothetical protein
MQKFNNQKKLYIENYVDEVKIRSLSFHKNSDTLTHLKIEMIWIHQQNKRNFLTERILSPF